MLGLKCYQGEVNMKPKKENDRTLPFKEEDIRYVIMNTKQHNNRKYKMNKTGLKIMVMALLNSSQLSKTHPKKLY